MLDNQIGDLEARTAKGATAAARKTKAELEKARGELKTAWDKLTIATESDWEIAKRSMDGVYEDVKKRVDDMVPKKR